MDWNYTEEGGGYFNENGETPSKSESKSATRQQFLCPVTIRQVIEAPDDGLKVGEFTASMVSLVGIVVKVDYSSGKLLFTLSDDTGVIDCVEWLEADEGETVNRDEYIVARSYYQVFGCIKTFHGNRKIMTFKVHPIQNFNEYTAFLTEVISANQYAEKINKMPVETIRNQSLTNKNKNFTENKSLFNPIQIAILQEIKAKDGLSGWSRKDSALTSKFSKKQMEDALEFLISEGHIYSTMDDEHYHCT